MRKKLSLTLMTLLAVAGLTALAPPAQARSTPVEVKRDSCGNTNVYYEGHPLFEYATIWCGPSPQ
jgi:hypothetical protein